MEPLAAHLAVIDRRLDALALAIRRRQWAEVEFTFDQVNRAVGKLARTVPRAGDAPPPDPA